MKDKLKALGITYLATVLFITIITGTADRSMGYGEAFGISIFLSIIFAPLVTIIVWVFMHPKKPYKEVIQQQRDEQSKHAKKVRELDASGAAYCPRCLSTSISSNKRGFGIGKAVIGHAVAGNIGLVAGNIGSQKVRCTCLKCGYSWIAGEK